MDLPKAAVPACSIHTIAFFCITSLPCLDCSKLTARNQSIDDHCREIFIFSPSTAAWLWVLKKDPSSTSNQWCVLNLHESWLGLKPSRTLWGSPGYKSFSCPLFLSFFFLNKFIYLFIGCIGSSLPLSFLVARVFSRCSERGLLFIVVRVLLIAVASLVAEHGL